MYWRIGSRYQRRPGAKNRRDFLSVVRAGPAPGLLAFEGERAVGWCQVTPRNDLAFLERAPRLQPLPPGPVWSVSCFYIRRGFRRRGVSEALLTGAVEHARASGAPALEAYPSDVALAKAPQPVYTGVASMFARAGFRRVAGQNPAPDHAADVPPAVISWRRRHLPPPPDDRSRRGPGSPSDR
jgi:GNAT superfamily N-acetyltransferase